ncbi:type I secretion C-terminal target domain-containing protein (plasmid) [Rhizobium sp. WL3]|uniref:T1SS-143 repeat domain-containing protein n=1 Tax=Rhizobium sp. WL3 TaxID=2603277 RepID=UPI0011C1F7FA|nr:DUF5801 repeats-in-toxin domain-containing protein [Rhizobium sp. WL3]QEE43331.1 type I secretion C-terminal target domain-containing protein [Rhizobium sp. WL3]
MSIEDPRLSSIDNTSAADEFDSAVEQHLGFGSETVDGIEVAQAETPDTGRTDRLPAEAPVETAAATIPSEVSPDAGNVVTLPAGIELDNLEFEVEGDNLVLILADGTEVVVLGGAANIPTFVIGDVELPQVALFAALEGSNINVAAGPDGTFSAQGGPTASRNFNDDPINAGPEDFTLADLLGDTNFGDDVQSNAIFGGAGAPSIPLEIALTESFIYDEAVIADADLGNQIITGTLPFNPGPDFGTITRIEFAGASNVDEEGLGPQVLAGFTSGGRPITVTSFPAPTVGAVDEFVAVEAVDSEGNAIFTLTVNRVTGEFTFELVGQLDHPDAGANGAQDDLDDLLRLGFTYTVTDLDGDSVTGSFNIDVMDDAPTFGVADAGAVDEDYIYGGNVNEVDQGEGDGPVDDLPPKEELVQLLEVAEPNSGTFTSGSLGINWGADKGNAGGNAGLTGDADDRGVAFTQATLDALNAKGLKSDGVTLKYAMSPDGTTIIAYKPYDGEGEGPLLLRVSESSDELSGDFFKVFGEEVFIVSVSDVSANGTYEFQLIGNIDHPDTTTEDDLAIEFLFTAQDSDGDTGSSSFTVTVNDDSPILVGDPETITLTVDEDDIQTTTSVGTAPNDGDATDGSFTGTPGQNTGGPANATSMAGNLLSLVKVGADENVTFSLISVAAARTFLEGLGLTSNDLPLGFDIDASGKIIGFVNSQAEGQAIPGQEYNAGPDRLVFEFEVSADGTFTFSLHDQLDHIKDDGNGETLTIDFGSVLQANDGDGDSVPLEGLVKVNVTDDAPVIVTGATAVTVKVDEDDIDTGTSLGNAPNDGNNPDGSFTGEPGSNTGGPANATSTGSLLSLVNVGADETVTFSLISIDAARFYLQGLNLTSNGLPLGFDLSENGTIIGFVNSQAPGQASPGQIYDVGDDRLVFEFQLNPNGTFTFSLHDQLDHIKLDGNDLALTIDFGSVLQATDNDGDSVPLSGLVKVEVTDDVPVIAPNATPITIKVDEDDIDTSTSLGNAPNDGNNPDGSYTGTPGVDTRGPANATSTVNLSTLVKVGADESVSFSLINQADMRAYLQGLKLTSNGAQIGYDLRTDGTIIAFVNAPGGQVPGETYDNGDRLVFEFKLNDDDTFTFSLSDQLDHPAGNGQNTLTIDFGAVLQATDNDGDSVKLTNLVKVDVTDDMPELIVGEKIVRTVDEDDIRTSQSTGTSPADGQGDGSWTGGPGQGGLTGGAFIDGSLAGLVKGGADDTVKFTFIEETALRAALTPLNLSSKGETLSFDLQGNVLWGFANVGGPSGVSYDQGDRPVFKLTLNENGTYSFELLDQLDHDAPLSGAVPNFDLRGSTADSIDFGSVIQVTDRDGDSITLDDAFTIEIRDDVPELVSGEKEERIVDEDDIRNGQSMGTSPNDSVADGSLTGGPANNQTGPAFISGSLANLVKGGADDTVKFTFIDEAALRQSLAGLGMSSKGEVLSFDVQGNVLWGFANVGGPSGVSYDQNDRPVFKLTLNENGTYTFELMDQLDHDAPVSPSDPNFDLRGSAADAINFGAVIKVTDHDGDSITLNNAFTIKIRDDVPELVAGKNEARTVDEDDIKTTQSTGTSPGDGQGDGSYTGGPNQGGNGPAFIDGSLAYLVKGGADEALAFTFTTNAASVLQGLGLKSDGASLSYEVKGNVLYGFENKVGGDAYGEGDRVVFKLTLNTNGSYAFELVDQLDHVKPGEGANENFPLQPNVQAINFGAVINATDRDGDSVSLDGAFSIQVRDDIPTVGTNPLIQLDDDALTGGIAGGPGDDVETAVLTGTLSHEAGADGVASILWAPNGLTVSGGFWFELSADSKTMTITQNQGVNGDNYVPVFKAVITNTLTGAYEIVQLAPVKHAGTIPGAEDNSPTVGFQYIVTDGDGDAVRGNVSFNIDDDTPTVVENALIQLDDDALAGGNAGGPGDDVQTTLLSGTLAHSGGADGTASVLWAPNGIDVPFGFWFDLSADGKTMTITQEQGDPMVVVPVFKAVITDPSTGAFEVTQLAPVMHDALGTEDNEQISFQYRVTDGDGDVATGTLTINVDDDTPVANKIEASRMLDDEAQTLFPGNNGSNLIFDLTDVSTNRSVVSGGAGSLFKAGADGMKSVSIVGPAFAVIFMDEEGFAQSETVTWDAGAPGDGGSTIFTATSFNYQDGAAVLEVRADGSYTFTMKAPLAHPEQSLLESLAEEDQTLRFDFTVIDGDGDTASGSLSIKVDDDTPEPLINIVRSAVLDDEAQSVFTPVNIGGTDDVEPNLKTVSGGPGALFKMGADGLSALSVELPALVVLAKAANGFAAPELVEWDEGVRSAGGMTTFTGTSESYPGGAAVLVIRADGSYQFTLNAPVAHTDSATNEDNTDLVFSYVVTDGDGDKAAGALVVSVDDDTPTGGAGTTAWLDDDSLAGGNPDGTGDNALANTSNVLKHSFGADGAGGIAWTGISVVGGGKQADFSSTVHDDGKTLKVFQGGTLVITGVLDPLTGKYTLTQNAPIDHVKGGDENEVKFQFKYDVTDGDGDVAPGYIWVNVDDDTPTGGAGTTAWLDDDSLAGGNPDGTGDNALANTSNVLKHSFGADGAGGIAWTGISVVGGGKQADFSSTVHDDGKTLKVFQGSTLVITGVLDPLTGKYTLTQNAPIDHVKGGDENEVKFQFKYDVTDGDGDVAPGYIWVNVDDDTPTGGAGTTAWLDDDVLTGGNPDGTGDNALANTSNVLKHSFGADGAGGIAWTGISVVGGGNQADFSSDVSDDGKTLEVFQGGTLVITGVLDPLTGKYTLTQNAPIDHVKGGDENEVKFQFKYDVTDGDGDVAPGYIWVNVDDDTPVASKVEASQMLDDEAQTLFAGNSGSNLFLDLSDVPTNRSSVSGEAGSLFKAGADGLKSVSIVGPALSVIFMDDKGFAHQEAVTWGAGTPGENGATVFTATSTNYANGAAVLQIGADGSYTFMMKAPLAHPEQNLLEQLLGEEEKTLNFDFTVADGDGDLASGSLSIKVDDDTPEPLFDVIYSAKLDDEAQSVFTPVNVGGKGDVDPDLKTVSGGAGALFKMGADGLSDLSVELPPLVVLAKAANGVAFMELADWSEGVRSANGVTTFTATTDSYPNGAAVLIIRADGSYEFTLNAPVAHTDAATKEDNADLVFGYVLTDGDGDKAAGALVVSVDDDTPVSTSILLEQDASVGQSISGSLASLVSFGADGVGMYTVETKNLSSSLTSLTSDGKPIKYTVDGDTLYGKVGGTTIFTFKVDQQTGEYTFKQVGQIDSASGVPAVGTSIEVPAEPGNGFQFVGRDENGNAIIKITNSSGSAVVSKLDWNGDEVADFTVTVSAGKTAYVNIGKPPANVGQSGNTAVELLDGTKNPPQTVVNPGHKFDGVALAVTLDLSSAVTVKDGDGDALPLSGQLNITIADEGKALYAAAAYKGLETDPIILDLDKDGFAFSSIDNGVTFDIDADGKGDQIAWTSNDGILAYDVDGNGLIDNGSEIFTPDFNGGTFASGVAALASLDSNGDGKIDASDDAFSKLSVWVDADNDGVSDEGELSSLFDSGVASISLTSDQTGGEEDGQAIFAEGEFTFADGSTGNFVEVGFETIFGSDLDGLTVIGTDGDDIMHGGMGQVVMTGGAGADTFVFDATALSELDVADVITDFSSEEGDVLDVTALLDSLLGEQATAETAASHLRSTVEDGNTTVSVQTGVDTWKDVVVLHNHDTAVKVLFDDKHSVTVTHD